MPGSESAQDVLGPTCLGCLGVLLTTGEQEERLCAACVAKYGPPKPQADSLAPKAGDPVGAALDIFRRDDAWVKCPGCGDEHRALGLTGVCLPCEGRAEDEKAGRRAHRERLVAMVGERGADDFTLEAFRLLPDLSATCAGRTLSAQDLRDAAAGFSPEHHSLFFTGLGGTGKTHLAVAITANWLWKLGAAAVEFHKVPRLLRWFHMRKPSEYDAEIERLARLKVLVLDDIGVEKDSEYNLGTLYEIIDARWSAKRNGLVVTSNLFPEDLAKKLDDDRLTSRLFGMCSVYRFKGNDMRLDGKGAKT